MGRNSTRSSVAAFFFLACSWRPVQAGGFRLTKIADSAQGFSSFSAPALNNNGTVAFWANTDPNGIGGIYAGSGGALTVMADGTMPVPVYGGHYREIKGPPSINNGGVVAFFGRHSFGDEFGFRAVFTTDGVTAWVSRFESGKIQSHTQLASIMDGGGVVYDICIDLSAFAGGAANVRANPLSPFLGFYAPATSRGGTKVVPAYLDVGPEGWPPPRTRDPLLGIHATSITGIFTRRGNAFITIADDGGPFSSLSHTPAINDAGMAVFLATLDSGGQGVFVGDGGLVVTIASTLTGFSSVASVPAINNHGQVAFVGGLNTGEGCLFVGDTESQESVICGGDALDGAKAGGFQIFREAINDLGQVAFLAGLDDGRQGIYRADPIPDTPFRRGDANVDGDHDLSDVLAILMYLFAAAQHPCQATLDANDDGIIDVSDPIGFLAYLFNQGFTPSPPFGSCGTDPTPDNLTCESFSPCQG